MKLTVSTRDMQWKKVKDLRKEGIIPAVIYGKNLATPLHVCAPKLQLIRTYEAAWMSTPVEITGDGINQLVLFQNIQVDPVTDRLLHVEFLAVNKDQKVSAEVPVLLTGVSQFEKLGLWRVQVVMQTIQVTALPLDLPHDIIVDISHIEHEWQVIHVSDLKVNTNVHIDEDMDAVVVTSLINEVAKEDEEVVETPAA